MSNKANMQFYTKHGFQIPIKGKDVLDSEKVIIDSTVVATNGKKNTQGNLETFELKVISRTKQFIICLCPVDGMEYAFSIDGLQLGRFAKYKLIQPSRIQFNLPNYLLVDQQHKIISFDDSTRIYKTHDEVKGSRVVNITNHGKGNILKEVIEVNGLESLLKI